MRSGYRFIPLLVIIVLLGLVIYFRWDRYIAFETIQRHHKLIQSWLDEHYLISVFAFMGIYAISVALSVPGATILTVIGGFLFGVWFGFIYVVLSATLGASIIFWAVKTSLGEWLAEKSKGWIKRMEEGFQKEAFNYLLFLRLVPLFPFWAVNIVPALLNVPFRTYALATFFGIMPGSLVYVALGNGFESLIVIGRKADFGIIFEPQILLPIIGLAILALIPVIYRKWRNYRRSHRA